MKIEKVKNYNQKLLAALGTIIVLFALIGLISLVYVLIDEAVREKRYRNQEDGILSEEKIEQLQTEKKRVQVISYNAPTLVDSLNLIYFIPVTHKTLNSPEEIDGNLLNISSGSGKNYDRRYSSNTYGDYNNVLIYDAKSTKVNKLFEDRVNFGKIRTAYFEDDVLLLIEAANQDTYRDGVINLDDYKSLYVYSVKNKKLHTINLAQADVYDASFIEGTKDMLILFGVDKNKDGSFDQYKEPTVLRRFDYKSQKLTEVVLDKLDQQLQKTLEGSK